MFTLCIIGGDLTKTLIYKKPSTRPQPRLSKPVSLDDIKPLRNNKQVETARTIELLYDVARSGLFHQTTENIPEWSSFHAILSPMQEVDIPVSRVAYNPILMAPASDISTVYTIMLRLKEAANALGQKYLPLCFDMGLLT